MNKAAQDPWRVGILFSRHGVTKVTESEHFFGTALAIEEINAQGGIFGRMIEPIAYDPRSDVQAYRSMARRLLGEDGVSVIFGGSMSASRKAILPIVEQRNGLLWYPSIYEGFEYSENVVYSGATLNQNILPLADFILGNYGKRVFLVGSDYIYPRESNRVMRDLIEAKGGEIVAEQYLPLEADTEQITSSMTEIMRQKPDVVFSTVVGRGAQTFYRLYSEAGINRSRNPIASLTMAEGEIGVIGPEHCSGHLTSATYFSTIDTSENIQFVQAFQRRYGAGARTSMWSETAYAQYHLFARALARIDTLDPQRLMSAVMELEFEAPEGHIAFEADNHHAWLTPRIGVARDDGGFDIAWQSKVPIRPDPYLASSKLEEVWIRE